MATPGATPGGDADLTWYFPDDIVFHIDSPGVPGRICCVQEAAQEAHVLWLTRPETESTERLEDLEVLDRALLHGDLVRERGSLLCGRVVRTELLLKVRH